MFEYKDSYSFGVAFLLALAAVWLDMVAVRIILLICAATFFIWPLVHKRFKMTFPATLVLVAGIALATGIIWQLSAYGTAWRVAAAQATAVPAPKSPSTPSLAFVFGAPLGDNASASWIMLIKHFGPETAYNCDISFYDNDRTNIEHLWLVAHPNNPYPPPGIADGASRHDVHLDEMNPDGVGGHFIWKPLDPNRQHYTVSISCRDGVFTQTWDISRVDGVLRSAITISHGEAWMKRNPGANPIVFRFVDPEFVRTPLATEVPKSTAAKVVHPGWKPNHTFPVPAAIIDPNGNVQTVSGVKLPDGTTQTDFGSWNILTRHFGDAPQKTD